MTRAEELAEKCLCDACRDCIAANGYEAAVADAEALAEALEAIKESAWSSTHAYRTASDALAHYRGEK